MKKIQIFLVALGAFFFLAAPAASAQDYGANPTTVLTDTDPAPGVTVTATGKGAPGAQVVISLSTASAGIPDSVANTDQVVLATGVVDSDSNYAVDFSIPTTTACGDYTLAVVVGGITTVSSAVSVTACGQAGGGGAAGGGAGTTPDQGAAVPSPGLAITGAETSALAIVGASLLFAGVVLVRGSRREELV